MMFVLHTYYCNGTCDLNSIVTVDNYLFVNIVKGFGIIFISQFNAGALT